MLIANGTQPFTPLAGTLPVGPEDTPVYDEILGAFLFGFANLELPPDANRPALPEQRVLIANGDIDRITPRFEVTPNATDFETYITVENLDHFSIAGVCSLSVMLILVCLTELQTDTVISSSPYWHIYQQNRY